MNGENGMELSKSLHDSTTTTNIPLSLNFEDDQIPKTRATIHVHPYLAYGDSPVDINEEGEVENTGSSSCSVMSLPNKKTEGLWESLIFDDYLKTSLLDYVKTALFFADRDIDCHLIPWNKLVLLYGPPGTGKVCLIK